MAEAARVDALLFDFGNVRVPIDFTRATRAWAAAAGKPHDAVHPRFSRDEAFRAYERDEIDAAAYCAHLRATLGLDLPDERLPEGWNAIFLEPEAETGRLVEELSHRYPLYLFSNTNRAHWAYWSARYAAMLTRFKGVFTSCDLRASCAADIRRALA